MMLKKLELSGFKSFGRRETLLFDAPIVAVVGPNGSGKSNIAEAFRWVLGEQSLKSLRGKKGEDLIFNGSSSLGRLSRAWAAITFDNNHRQFPTIDFDEVIISREVFRDGVNEYKINGSIVRLRDIHELLAGVSLGASSHHIISQGEADRILNASPTDRRSIVEEALGLKIYQWKLAESEKKLLKTEENLKQVESIRREIAPHLKFLKKQVEKIERVRSLKTELRTIYGDYLKREELYLTMTRDKITRELSSYQLSLKKINDQFSQEEIRRQNGSYQTEIIQEENKLRDLETKIRALRLQKDELSRALGRLEGLLEVRKQENNSVATEVEIPLVEIKDWFSNLDHKFTEIEKLSDLGEIKKTLVHLRQEFLNFLEKYESQPLNNEFEIKTELDKLKKEYNILRLQIEDLDNNENSCQTEIINHKERIINLRQKAQGAEHDFYELKNQKNELELQVKTLLTKQDALKIEEENFKRELAEAGILIGREILNYSDLSLNWDDLKNEDRQIQEDRRRKIERLKIRLEDLGVESSEVLREYDDVVARDKFLAEELNDLANSRESLLIVMSDLKLKINTEFAIGLEKINKEFQKFFSLLFGGGGANLEWLRPSKKKENPVSIDLSDQDSSLVAFQKDSDSEPIEGLDINVNLPRKKIKGLTMLSGGERALTSIALLFAMSQVNPPPFLILDETDAALDEANSRKYAEMVESLSKYSQLILITHNRETMSRAGILYGVTMGADSVSRLISIKFDEATQYAK